MPLKATIVTVLCGFILTLAACEDPNVTIDRLDPSINVRFIDMDSIFSLEREIGGIDGIISQLNDRLAEIDSLINSGDPTDYTQEISDLNELKRSLNSEKSELNASLNDVERGKILLDRILADGSSSEINYEDARETYRLPLDPRNTSTQFYIFYKNAINEVRFTYSTDTLFDEHVVQIMARQIQLSAFDYDSARISCDTLECNSTNAKVTFFL